ncbi:MAG: hypothetical protein JJE50_01190 [Actinomycetales bacterium]|nr:hypothetical protein [Actinomycetales bacterium]
MREVSLDDVAEQLAGLRLSDWHGLPRALEGGDLEDPPALVTLGADDEEAELVHLDDPRARVSARAWLRDGLTVLIEVTWRGGPDAEVLEVLGKPDERDDVVDGLVRLEGGEWIFAGRGLAAVVRAGRVHSAVGFVPTTAAAYRRSLRPERQTSRRPVRRDEPGEW